MKKYILITLIFTFIAISSMGQWLAQSTSFSNELRGLNSISIANEDVVWAIAYDGNDPNNHIQEFTKTIDGGETWVPGTIGVGSSGVTISQISAINKDTAWIAVAPNLTSHQGGVFITVNGGQDWTRQTTAEYTSPTSFTNVVHFWNKNDGFCQGDPIGLSGDNDFELYTTADGGTTWVLVDRNNIPDPEYGEWGYTAKSCVSGNSIWFGTNHGRIYRSSDKGHTWAVSQSPISDFGNNPINGSFAFTNASNGLLIDNTSGLWSTIDSGTTWNVVSATGNHYPTYITSITGLDGAYVNTWFGDVVGGEVIGGGVSYTTNNGSDWLNLSELAAIEQTVWLNPSTGWVGAFNVSDVEGGIYKFNDEITSVDATPPNDINITVFPNPSKGIFTIDNIKGSTVEVYDNLGQLVYSKQSNMSRNIIDLSTQNIGSYIIKINSGNAIVTKKLIIVK